MDEYEVILTPDALEDLITLRDYIAVALDARKAALDFVKKMRKAVLSLGCLPARNMLLPDEPWHSRGIRRLVAGSAYIYYRVDEDARKVYVLNVIHSRRDQLEALAKSDA